MINHNTQCLLQVFNKDNYHCQVFTTIELAAKTIFKGVNDKFYIPRYAVFIGGKSVQIEITMEGLPKIKIAIKDEESLINVIIKEL